jgi:acyl dehydratase
MSAPDPPERLPTLRVTPDRHVTVRYAGASGDFNPIHVDEEFARSVGLPGRILHGLYTMALVARAQTEALGGAAHLRRLEVQFRGAAVPEEEIAISSTITERTPEHVVVRIDAEQGGRTVIRGATAELDI